MLPLKITPHISMLELKKIYRKEKSAKQMKRYQAILWSYNSNFYPNVSEIAKKLCMCKQTIYSWIKDWNNDGLEGLKIKKQSGQPPKLTEEELNQLIAELLENPRDAGYDFSTWTLKAIAGHIQKKFNTSVSLSGIYRMLKRNKMTLIVPRPMPVKGDAKKKKNLSKN
ncbi:MAG: helix-turn-helix domain-containing protein [Promethearchaeota archaeon]